MLVLCADIEVTCYAYEGINAIKDALTAGLAKSTEQLPIKVQQVSALDLAASHTVRACVCVYMYGGVDQSHRPSALCRHHELT